MEIAVILANLIYSGIGAAGAIFAMVIGYRVLDRMTEFNTSEQLANNNIAVGVMVAGMFIGLGIVVGNVIGMALN